MEELFGGYTYYSREQADKKVTKYSATTANTHGSYTEEKESVRGKKPKTNNFFKL